MRRIAASAVQEVLEPWRDYPDINEGIEYSRQREAGREYVSNAHACSLGLSYQQSRWQTALQCFGSHPPGRDQGFCGGTGRDQIDFGIAGRGLADPVGDLRTVSEAA